MATVQRKPARVGRYSTSDEVIRWVESIAGLVAHIKTTYGGVSELIEHPHWDESRNSYAASLLAGLRKEIITLEKEFSEHVNQRQQKRRR